MDLLSGRGVCVVFCCALLVVKSFACFFFFAKYYMMRSLACIRYIWTCEKKFGFKVDRGVGKITPCVKIPALVLFFAFEAVMPTCGKL